MSDAPDKSIEATEAPVKRWAWTSRGAESKDVISVLACVETVGCSALWLWMIVVHGWWWPAVMVCIAPLVLLRTPESVGLGLRYLSPAAVVLESGFGRVKKTWARGIDLLDDVPWPLFFICLLPGFLIFQLSAPFVGMAAYAVVIAPVILVKIVATAVSLVKRPRIAVAAIPKNWRIACLYRDSTLRLELLPGVGSLAPSDTRKEIFGLPTVLIPTGGGKYRILLAGAYIAVYLPAIAYRYSVKASALVYWPLSYVVTGAFIGDTGKIIVGICDWNWRFVRLPLALWSTGLLVAKLAANEGIASLRKLDAPDWVMRLIHEYIVPLRIPGWQFVAGINGAAAIALYFWADYTRKMEVKSETNATALRAVAYTSSVAGFYTIGCMAIILLRLADLRAPVIGPWWPGM